MPRVLGNPSYIKYSELDEGNVIVEKGRFEGVREGKFGEVYDFYDLETNEHKVLPKAGAISWRIAQGHIMEGDIVRITYLGKTILERGMYKGKEANNFKIEIWDDPDEIEEIERQARNKSESKTSAKAKAVTVDDNEVGEDPLRPRRGRPAKVKAVDEEEVGEDPLRPRRGRPAKVKAVDEEEEKEEEEETYEPPRPRRGRPPKLKVVEENVDETPRRRRRESSKEPIDEIDALV